MDPSTRAAMRRAVAVALLVSAALSVEIVLSNVVFPSPTDDDGVAVIVSYLGVFAALGVTGVLTSQVTDDRRTIALTGAGAGALIGILTTGTFFAVDNLFLDVVARQQTKIEGLARSGSASMRAFINTGLVGSLVVSTALFAVVGAGLALAGAAAARRPATPPRRPTA